MLGKCLGLLASGAAGLAELAGISGGHERIFVVPAHSASDDAAQSCAAFMGLSDIRSEEAPIVHFWRSGSRACSRAMEKDSVASFTVPRSKIDNLYILRYTERDAGASPSEITPSEVTPGETSPSQTRFQSVGSSSIPRITGADVLYTADWGSVMHAGIAAIDMFTRHAALGDVEFIKLGRGEFALDGPSAYNMNAPVRSSAPPVDPGSVARVQALIDNLEYDESIGKILDSVRMKAYKRDVQTLSGEHQEALSEGSRWYSRHSMSVGSRKASQWLMREFQEYGFTCAPHKHHAYLSPNVICERKGTGANRKTVILGAHYDSRGTFGEITAPGADDDGSGTALLLAIARALHENNVETENDVIIGAFSGEEQGLIGSHVYAEDLRKENTRDVLLMIQADMVAYRKPGEPLQVGFPDLIGLLEARYYLGNVSSVYTPELEVGLTPACCSDHQSFVAQGFPSSWVFERAGPIADPFYHNSGDLSEREGYSYEQAVLITRLVLAAALNAAGLR